MRKSIEELPDNALVGTKSAAEYLGCSMQSVRNGIKAGKIPIVGTTLGGNYRGGYNRIRLKDLKVVKDTMQKSAKEKRR